MSTFDDVDAVSYRAPLRGGEPPAGWDDVTCALKGTGRLPLTDDDRTAPGLAAAGFPLLG